MSELWVFHPMHLLIPAIATFLAKVDPLTVGRAFNFACGLLLFPFSFALMRLVGVPRLLAGASAAVLMAFPELRYHAANMLPDKIASVAAVGTWACAAWWARKPSSLVAAIAVIAASFAILSKEWFPPILLLPAIWLLANGCRAGIADWARSALVAVAVLVIIAMGPWLSLWPQPLPIVSLLGLQVPEKLIAHQLPGLQSTVALQLSLGGEIVRTMIREFGDLGGTLNKISPNFDVNRSSSTMLAMMLSTICGDLQRALSAMRHAGSGTGVGWKRLWPVGFLAIVFIDGVVIAAGLLGSGLEGSWLAATVVGVAGLALGWKWRDAGKVHQNDRADYWIFPHLVCAPLFLVGMIFLGEIASHPRNYFLTNPFLALWVARAAIVPKESIHLGIAATLLGIALAVRFDVPSLVASCALLVWWGWNWKKRIAHYDSNDSRSQIYGLLVLVVVLIVPAQPIRRASQNLFAELKRPKYSEYYERLATWAAGRITAEDIMITNHQNPLVGTLDLGMSGFVRTFNFQKKGYWFSFTAFRRRQVV